MKKSERYAAVLDYFRDNVPDPQGELHWQTPFQLLCAVMLSAQCTDKRVNMVTPLLFEAYPTVESLADAPVEEVKQIIKSISYPNAKAEHLVEMARRLISDYGGEVPSEPKELEKLPGVGRKTASVVGAICFGKSVIAVDTHVFRVAHRIGLSDGKTPSSVQDELESRISKELHTRAHHWLLLHGRYICTARTPRCSECPMTEYCRFFQKSDRQSA